VGIKLSFIADIQGGYLVNPATNLKFYGSYIYRSFDPTATTFNVSTSWFTLGLRADVLIGILIISSAFSKIRVKLKIETLIL
jgi:hypothetical protein